MKGLSAHELRNDVQKPSLRRNRSLNIKSSTTSVNSVDKHTSIVENLKRSFNNLQIIDKKDDSQFHDIYEKNKLIVSKSSFSDTKSIDLKTSQSSNLTDIYKLNENVKYSGKYLNDAKTSNSFLARTFTSTSFLNKIPSESQSNLKLLTSGSSPLGSNSNQSLNKFKSDEIIFQSVDDYLSISGQSETEAVSAKPSVYKSVNYSEMSLEELINYDDSKALKRQYFSDTDNWIAATTVSSDENFDLIFMEFKKPHKDEFNRDYWLVNKLVRYLKAGNPTATYIALAMIRDLELGREAILYFLLNAGAIIVLINLLTTNDLKCQCGAMQILKILSTNDRMAFEIIKEGGVVSLIKNLSELDDDAKCLAADCLANLSKLKIARSIIRRRNGIHKLITVLAFAHVSIKQNTHLMKRKRTLIVSRKVRENIHSDALKMSKNYELIKSVSYALYALSKDVINHYIMLKHGIILLLSNIIKTTTNEKCLFWLIALLDNCAATDKYVTAITTEHMIEYLVNLLQQTNDIKLRVHLIGIFSKCSKDPTLCNALKGNVISELCELAAKTIIGQSSSSSSSSKVNLHQTISLNQSGSNTLINELNEKLIRNIAGTISGCCIHSSKTIEYLMKSKIIEKLIVILKIYINENSYKKSFSDETIINITKTLNVSVYLQENRKKLLNLNAFEILVKLLQANNNHEIIINTCYILGLCSLDSDCLNAIYKLDVIRLVWSLLRNRNVKVQEAACWFLYVCIERIKNFGELVRNLTGGIELLVSLLDYKTNINVLAYGCAALSKITIDNDNLAVVTDYKVANKLIHLVLEYYRNSETTTQSDINQNELLLLKMFLAEAIAQCSRDVKNSAEFGKKGTIEPLVKFLSNILNKNLPLKTKTKENRLKSNRSKTVRNESSCDVNINSNANFNMLCKKQAIKINLHYCPCDNINLSLNKMHKSIVLALKELSNCKENCFKMYKQGATKHLIESIGSVDEQIQKNSAICLKNIRKLILTIKNPCYKNCHVINNHLKFSYFNNHKKFSFENLNELVKLKISDSNQEILK